MFHFRCNLFYFCVTFVSHSHALGSQDQDFVSVFLNVMYKNYPGKISKDFVDAFVQRPTRTVDEFIERYGPIGWYRASDLRAILNTTKLSHSRIWKLHHVLQQQLPEDFRDDYMCSKNGILGLLGRQMDSIWRKTNTTPDVKLQEAHDRIKNEGHVRSTADMIMQFKHTGLPGVNMNSFAGQVYSSLNTPLDVFRQMCTDMCWLLGCLVAVTAVTNGKPMYYAQNVWARYLLRLARQDPNV